MNSDDRHDLFVSWASLLIESSEFDNYESNYKVELSRSFNELRSAGLTADAIVSWLASPENNVVGWRTVAALREADGGELERATKNLLHDGDLFLRVDEFTSWMAAATGESSGPCTTVASALLMGLDATRYPPYKTRAIQRVMELAGHQPAKGSPAERYTNFLEFCDEMANNVSARLERKVSRLDIQGACWVIGHWDDAEVLLGDRSDEFEAWRGGNPKPSAVSSADRAEAALIWWVNQGATYQEERDGGYIWAPQQARNGAVMAHHRAVSTVRKGDRIVHYSQKSIRAVGIATSDGYESTRPGELPEDSWQSDGFRADVDYEELEDPIPLSRVPLDIRLEPGGPFTTEGAVKQGYLFQLPELVRAKLEGVIFDDELSPSLPDPRPLREVVDEFTAATRDSGLTFGRRHEQLIRSFIVALATKPFVILTGLSGSGKTQLARQFGSWIGELKIVPVRPDWTSPDSLLGFENALSEPVDGQYAWNVPETLKFVLQARDNPRQPHLLLLDEMNLAHVERYFADVLSGMESGAAVVPDLVLGDDGQYRQRDGGTGLFRLPRNLFVVGTVNIDETTYMFSPKVLDRANTFEFRVDTPDLIATHRPVDPDKADESFGLGLLQARSETDTEPSPAFAQWMRDVHGILSEADREFGHRTFQEAIRFAGLLQEAGEAELLVALDYQIAQKVLPRLHGSRRELTQLLDRLGAFCFFGPEAEPPSEFTAAEQGDGDPALPLSFGKVHRMAKKLRDQHFVSFAE